MLRCRGVRRPIVFWDRRHTVLSVVRRCVPPFHSLLSFVRDAVRARCRLPIRGIPRSCCVSAVRAVPGLDTWIALAVSRLCPECCLQPQVYGSLPSLLPCSVPTHFPTRAPVSSVLSRSLQTPSVFGWQGGRSPPDCLRAMRMRAPQRSSGSDSRSRGLSCAAFRRSLSPNCLPVRSF